MNKTELINKTKTELLKIAQRLGLRGVTTLNKAELADKISKAKQQKAANAKRQPFAATMAAAAKKLTSVVRRRAIRKRATTTPPAAPPKAARKSRKEDAQEKPVTPAAAAAVAAHKFDVSPKAKPSKPKVSEKLTGELPESYGTGRLFLVARDPGWLFAYWDLTGQQMAEYRQKASDGRLVLRLFEKGHAHPAQELTVHQDSRNWYLSGTKGATTYSAQLGYWRHDGHFHVVGQSRETTTPSAVVSSDTTAQFATIPVDVPFEELIAIVRSYSREGEPLAEALNRLQSQGTPFPFKVGVEIGPWTAEQTVALEREMGGDVLRRLQMGSFEISEWLRRRLQENLSSGAFSPGGASWSAAPGVGKGFWFAVNAELIIYGATEPDAKVTIDGKPVALNRDGTFQYHYAFPDGKYRLPVVAVSATGDDQRAVELDFQRTTTARGEVGAVNPPVPRSKPS